jgi:hypothetical protein
MAVALYPSNSTDFELPHRNLCPIRCREAREVRSVSCSGKLDSSRPGHDRVLSRHRVKDMAVRFDSLRSGPGCKPARAKKLLSEAGFAGRLFSKAERSRKVSVRDILILICKKGTLCAFYDIFFLKILAYGKNNNSISKKRKGK